MELERDQRTVFVSQLVKKADETVIKKYFENVGKVRNVIMIRDRKGRHKGFAYVEMDDLEDVPKVLMLHEVVPDFQKFSIVVKASEAEKNFVAKREADEAKKTGGGNKRDRRRLYVGNLNSTIADADLLRLFAPFGDVESALVQRNEVGVSRGHAFVTFKEAKTAELALEGMNGVDVLGQPLRMNFVGEGPAGTASAADAAVSGKGNWRLDDGGDSGVTMNASSRAALMAKLGNRAGLPPPAMPPVPTMPAMPAIPAPVVAGPAPAVPMPAAQAPAAAPAQAAQTKLLIVMNMFDPAQEASEAGPNWDQEIREDVEQEVSKFGTPVYVQVDKVDPKGCVYIAFSEVQGAVKTSEGLNGRFFAGKQIVTQFLSPTAFLSKCPSAAAMV